MKISKLAIASVLTMGLALTGCFDKKASSSAAPSSSDTSSGSQVDPVSTINVRSLSRALIVGETLNLDDYVTVVGGADPKGYTAEVQSGATAVSLQGKTLTANAEGEFKIRLSAGEKTGTLSGEVLTEEAAAFQSYLNAFPSEYGVQLQTYNESDEIVDAAGKKIIHRDDYLGHFGWTDDKPSKPGGWFIAADDNFYEWTADDMAGTNFQAIPGAQGTRGTWGQYYINMPPALSFSNFERVYDEGTGDLIGFSMDDSVPGDSNFPTAIDLLMYCAAGYNFRDDYDKTLYVWFEENEQGEFSYEFELIYTTDDNEPATPEDTSDDHTYGFPFRFLTETADITIAPVEEYIASGEHPEPINFDEITTRANQFVTAKNYEFILQTSWFTSSFQAVPAAYPVYYLELDADYLNNSFEYVVESGSVTENGIERTTVEDVYEDVSEGQVQKTGTVTTANGYITHNDNVYYYSKDSEAAEYTTQNTGVAASALWTTVGAYLGTALVPGQGFEVSGRTENEDGSITFSFASGSASAVAVAQAVNKLGMWNYTNRINNSSTYVYAQVVVGADYISYYWGINFGLLHGQCLTIGNIGSATLPLDEATIFGA